MSETKMAVDLECERTTKCWEDHPDRDDLKAFNWRERTYFADTRHGKIIMAEIRRDRDTGQITETVETRQRCDRPIDFLTYQDVEAIFDLCKETDCTIMEAVISHVGEQNIPDSWIQRALDAPVVRYKYAKAYQAEVTKPVQKKVFTDPKKPRKMAAAVPAPTI